MLENLAVVLLPRPSLPGAQPGDRREPDWSTVPFIMADQGPVRRRIELWFRRHKISNPSIYATVGGHEAMVSMVAWAAWRCCRKWCWRTVRNRYATRDDSGAQR
jgi:LysR family positive regulator for ilvC